MAVIIDVRIVSYIRYSSILFKLHVIIIGCIHGCKVQVVNQRLSSLKLKRKKIGLTYKINNR